MEITPSFQGMQSALNKIPCFSIVPRNSEIFGFNKLKKCFGSIAIQVIELVGQCVLFAGG